MSWRDTCPVCSTAMEPDNQIGPYCLNEACPVTDDALLWYKDHQGIWKSQNWIATITKDGSTILKLSEREME